MPIQAPKGTRDILPAEIHKWHYLESQIRDLCRLYAYNEIRVPLFEHTELFSRGVGETTDVVQKEMYTFPDKAGRSLTLRPEGTAGVARAFIENGMQSLAMPHKMYYYGPMYRYENVQHGRYREFWQFGCEVIGAAGPDADVELISVLESFFARAGLTRTDLHINSIGCPACRPRYHEALAAFLEPNRDNLCADCRARISRNPLRVIDCKQAKCKKIIEGAPLPLDHVCAECADHFGRLQAGLANAGIKYTVDKSIVRGLDYYTRTVFEYLSDNVKSLGSTICGGGRYDGLVGVCGGPDTPGVGFSLGMERLFIELESYGINLPRPEGADIFIIAKCDSAKGDSAASESTAGAATGDSAALYAARLAGGLRASGVSAETDLNRRSVKAQMKYADKRNAKYTVVIGEDELASGAAKLRKMADGTECAFELAGAAEFIKNLLHPGI